MKLKIRVLSPDIALVWDASHPTAPMPWECVIAVFRDSSSPLNYGGPFALTPTVQEYLYALFREVEAVQEGPTRLAYAALLTPRVVESEPVIGPEPDVPE